MPIERGRLLHHFDVLTAFTVVSEASYQTGTLGS